MKYLLSHRTLGPAHPNKAVTLHFHTTNHLDFFWVFHGLWAVLHSPQGYLPKGPSLNSLQSWEALWGFSFSLRHCFFLKMNNIYLWRKNDSMFSVNSCIIFIPPPVSTIWSIYKVFHWILFWDRLLVWRGRNGGTQLSTMESQARELSPASQHCPGHQAQAAGSQAGPRGRARKDGVEEGTGSRKGTRPAWDWQPGQRVAALAWNSFPVVTCVCEGQRQLPRKRRMENDGYRRLC